MNWAEAVGHCLKDTNNWIMMNMSYVFRLGENETWEWIPIKGVDSTKSGHYIVQEHAEIELFTSLNEFLDMIVDVYHSGRADSSEFKPVEVTFEIKVKDKE